MRDVLMDISATAIETFHKTPHYESNFYDTLNEDEMDYDEIIEFLIDGRDLVQHEAMHNGHTSKNSYRHLITEMYRQASVEIELDELTCPPKGISNDAIYEQFCNKHSS
ncbi:hypothetical protein Goklo_024813 [Gossypium klotzschianum]|uniref:Uncharacterized protein n=1 Tax=Gossypium klotzschianum TaxID=34286 RepID=A0A7J8W598_9ROSI|nr:hypothetical protein [Gossypium klotzschianum]